MTFRRAFILSRANATRKAPHFPRFLNLTPGPSPLSAMNSTPTLFVVLGRHVFDWDKPAWVAWHQHAPLIGALKP